MISRKVLGPLLFVSLTAVAATACGGDDDANSTPDLGTDVALPDDVDESIDESIDQAIDQAIDDVLDEESDEGPDPDSPYAGIVLWATSSGSLGNGPGLRAVEVLPGSVYDNLLENPDDPFEDPGVLIELPGKLSPSTENRFQDRLVTSVDWAWAILDSGQRLVRADRASAAVDVEIVATDLSPTGMIVAITGDADGIYAAVADGVASTNTVIEFDPVSGDERRRIEIPFENNGEGGPLFTIVSDSTHVVTSNQNGPNVMHVIDRAGGEIVASIGPIEQSSSPALAGGELIVASSSGNVQEPGTYARYSLPDGAEIESGVALPLEGVEPIAGFGDYLFQFGSSSSNDKPITQIIPDSPDMTAAIADSIDGRIADIEIGDGFAVIGLFGASGIHIVDLASATTQIEFDFGGDVVDIALP